MNLNFGSLFAKAIEAGEAPLPQVGVEAGLTGFGDLISEMILQSKGDRQAEKDVPLEFAQESDNPSVELGRRVRATEQSPPSLEGGGPRVHTVADEALEVSPAEEVPSESLGGLAGQSKLVSEGQNSPPVLGSQAPIVTSEVGEHQWLEIWPSETPEAPVLKEKVRAVAESSDIVIRDEKEVLKPVLQTEAQETGEESLPVEATPFRLGRVSHQDLPLKRDTPVGLHASRLVSAPPSEEAETEVASKNGSLPAELNLEDSTQDALPPFDPGQAAALGFEKPSEFPRLGHQVGEHVEVKSPPKSSPVAETLKPETRGHIRPTESGIEVLREAFEPKTGTRTTTPEVLIEGARPRPKAQPMAPAVVTKTAKPALETEPKAPGFVVEAAGSRPKAQPMAPEVVTKTAKPALETEPKAPGFAVELAGPRPKARPLASEVVTKTATPALETEPKVSGFVVEAAGPRPKARPLGPGVVTKLAEPNFKSQPQLVESKVVTKSSDRPAKTQPIEPQLATKLEKAAPKESGQTSETEVKAAVRSSRAAAPRQRVKTRMPAVQVELQSQEPEPGQAPLDHDEGRATKPTKQAQVAEKFPVGSTPPQLTLVTQAPLSARPLHSENWQFLSTSLEQNPDAGLNRMALHLATQNPPVALPVPPVELPQLEPIRRPEGLSLVASEAPVVKVSQLSTTVDAPVVTFNNMGFVQDTEQPTLWVSQEQPKRRSSATGESSSLEVSSNQLMTSEQNKSSQAQSFARSLFQGVSKVVEVSPPAMVTPPPVQVGIPTPVPTPIPNGLEKAVQDTPKEPVVAEESSMPAGLTKTTGRSPANPQGLAPTTQGVGSKVSVSELSDVIFKNISKSDATRGHRLELELSPERLGKLTVELSLSPDGKKVDSLMLVSSEAAREVLEQQMPQLKAKLSDMGLDLETRLLSTSENHSGADNNRGGREQSSSLHRSGNEEPNGPSDESCDTSQGSELYA